MREQKTVKMKYKGKDPIHFGGGLKVLIVKKGDVINMPELMAIKYLEKHPKDWEKAKAEKPKGKKGGK